MKIDWQKTASIGICFTLALFFLFLLGKYILAVFLPFVIAWAMALLTNSIASAICARIKISKKLCCAVVLLILFLLIGVLLYFGVNRFITEIENFIGRLTADGSILSRNFSQLVTNFDNIGSHIPLIKELKGHESLVEFNDKIDEMIVSFLKGLASDLGTALTTIATGMIKSLPSIILFVLISIIASFYFALDFEEINDYILKVMPSSLRKRIPGLGRQTKSLAVRYLKAYSILMLLTFFELFVGLSIIGADYAFLLAIGISILDILPVFGVGTVLIPWAIFSFFTYDFGRGIALVILWAVVTVIRQVAEPKIVGGTIGLHPVVTLIGMYVGFRLFGIIGMFIAPTAIIAVRAYFGKQYVMEDGRAIDSGQKK